MEIKQSILATIVYYDRLDYPLTLFEVYRFLINPRRLDPKIPGINEISMGEISGRLDELLESGQIQEHWGMYFLKDRSLIVTERLEREKISAQKWKRCLRKARWFQAVPWLEAMFASGSLALGNTTESSDYDMLVVVRSGRLYLARLFLSGLASLLRIRRTRYQESAPDKFCFNHYVASDRLTITHESLYNAQTYAHLVPIFDRRGIASQFAALNLWLNKYLYNYKPHYDTIGRTIKKNKWLSQVARILEFVLNNPLGDLLEKLARAYQQKRIRENPATHALGGRVVFTDHELEFHPKSFETKMLDAYNKMTHRLSITTQTEPDSGLN